LASDISKTATAGLLADVLKTPSLSSLRQRIERGDSLPLETVARAAQPFLPAIIRRMFPERPIVVVTEDLRAQESYYQDLQTWISGSDPDSASSVASALAFYPAWEMLPHETKLPHPDVIGDRLETLVKLSQWAGQESSSEPPLVVTNVTALLQKTFPATALNQRIRVLQKGDRLDPLDFIEWLEEQGYDPEVQVNHRGEIALRGGIVDVFPSPAPGRCDWSFLATKLNPCGCLIPITQISREPLQSIAIPPGGELGILKRVTSAAVSPKPDDIPDRHSSTLATLLEYLPRENNCPPVRAGFARGARRQLRGARACRRRVLHPVE
jgi:transcription-repair coupling factor (superfamily II helicase)